MRPRAHTERPIERRIDRDPALRETIAPRRLCNLQVPLAHLHTGIGANDALVLHRTDALQRPARVRDKGRVLTGGHHGPAPVVERQPGVLKKLIGGRDRRDSSQPQLLREPPLPGLPPPFHAAAGLGRVRRDQLDAQLLSRPLNLRGPPRLLRPMRTLVRARRDEVTRAIRIQTAEESLLGDHGLQRREHGAGALLGDQAGVVDEARRIIQDRDQVLRPVQRRTPGMRAGVRMEQHPRSRPTRPRPAMHAPPPVFRHQARRLQRRLHPRIGEVDPMHRLQLLMEVQDVTVRILLTIERQHPPHRLPRHPFRGGAPPAPIKEAIIAASFIAPFPAPHLPIRDPEDLGRLIPFQSSVHGSQEHFLPLHRPLFKRSCHLLREADGSYATDNPQRIA